MANNKEPLNGSVELLARAMREVITDAVTQGIGPLSGQVACIREDLAGVKEEVKILGVRMDNMESNVQAQLAEHRKQVAADIRRQLSRL